MAGIPPIVPKTLRNEVAKVQEQLKILINNYKILKYRLDNDPQNEVLESQINVVKEYIHIFNQEQCALLEKIRQFLRDLETGQFFKKEVVPDKRPKNSSPASKNSSANDSENEEESGYLDYLTTSESSFPGHVESYSIDCPARLELCDKTDSLTAKYKIRDELDDSNADQPKHMLNIGLLPAELLDDFLSSLHDQRSRHKYREFLTVPEVSDKKYRNQSFLVKLAVSPPQLRKRKKENLTKVSRPVRAITFPPERMGTRKQNSMKRLEESEELREMEKLRRIDPDYDVSHSSI